MSTINIQNLTFGYDGSHDNIFENVSLQIDTDWKIGLIGRNGKGKTTLLKLLLGQLEYKGKISAQVEFEYFPFAIADKEQCIYEIIEDIIPTCEEWRVHKELNLLELEDIDLYRPFDSYSNGEQTKIMLAILFLRENTFLLIDEPTNHLDKLGRQVLAKYLDKKSSYIMVSHDRRFLDNCIDHVMSINMANIEVQKGNLTSYLENKSRQDAFEYSQNEKLKGEIQQLKKAAKRTTDWANTAEKAKFNGKQDSGLKVDRGYVGAKAAKLMKRATVMKDRMAKSLEEKSSLLKNVDRQDSIAIKGQEFFKQRLLVVQNLVVSYDGRAINAPLTFEINYGERIALVGKNGCGKTSVIKAILGRIDEYSGNIEYNNQLMISYLSQDTSCVKGTIDEFCTYNAVDKTALLTMLYKLGLEPTQYDKRLQEYSEGQKKKLLIAMSLCQQANLYIWDEPLNYIDIISREQIKNMLTDSNVSMLFVEHDEEFFDSVATKIIEIN